MLYNVLSLFPCITALNLLYMGRDLFGFGRLPIYILEMRSTLLKSFQIILAKYKFAAGAFGTSDTIKIDLEL